MELRSKFSWLLLLLVFAAFDNQAQSQVTLPDPNWQHRDLTADGIFGISTDKAYNELLKGKKGKQVLVAVIDGGVDTNHVDLRANLWKGKTGFGWSYLGSNRGNVAFETLELVRMIRDERRRFAEPLSAAADTSGFGRYQNHLKELKGKLEKAKGAFQYYNGMKLVLDTIRNVMANDNPTLEELKAYVPETSLQSSIKALIIKELKEKPGFEAMYVDLAGVVAHFRDQVEYTLNLEFDPRPIVGDQIDDVTETQYGTTDVMGPDASHGTHVSGIIGALRNNGIGLDGVADNVRVINIRAVPNGDERDKDVANAIFFAVDHGARIINMSFGKPFSPNKTRVDEAVKYAIRKGVLLVHAAGNDATDLDNDGKYYPVKEYADGKGTAAHWIEVGASGPKNDKTLVAPFSNYGRSAVDVFAPGVSIYSTVPSSEYKRMDGTSMAAPVVSGLAALIMSYYPKLGAEQVKEIIMKSVTKVSQEVSVVKSGVKRMVPFSEVCVSGGVVNVYEALKLAASYR